MTQPSYKCAICQDSEFVIEQRPGKVTLSDGTVNEILQDVAVSCKCREKRRIERLLKSSQITDEFKKMTFGNFVTSDKPAVIQEMYAKAYRYVQEFGKEQGTHNSCCFLGQPGAGKTHLLAAVTNNLLARGIAVQYFPWVEGTDELKSDLEAAKDKIYQMQRVPVLFVDDLFKGRDKPTNWQTEMIFGIINYRYLNKLPMLVCSERTIAELCAFDEAAASRLVEMSRDYTVVIKRDITLNNRLPKEI